MRSRGFSLVEVLVAMVVLAIGVLGVAQLQASSLRASAKGEAIQDVTGIARAELEARLQMGLSPLSSQNCGTRVPDNYDCRVKVDRCAIVGGSLTCAGVESGGVGYEITVTATGPRGDVVSLSSFAGAVVSAAGDTVEDGEADNGEEDENGDGENGDDESSGQNGDGEEGEEDGGGDDGDGSGDDGSGGEDGGTVPDCWPPQKKACR